MKNMSRLFSIGWLCLLILISFWKLLKGNLIEMNVNNILMSPNSQYIFGTDSLGRDLFERVLIGAQFSFLIGISSVILAMLIGIPYGLTAGWRLGATDRVLMKVTELLLSIPSIVMVLIITLLIQGFLYQIDLQLKIFISVVCGVGLSHWMNIARTVRGMTLKIRNETYIEAAQALGATDYQIMKTHILPNMRNQLLAIAVLQVASNILYEGYISFLGIGVQAPNTSLGFLVKEGWRTLSSFPHLMLFPALVLFLTIWSIQILADNYFKH